MSHRALLPVALALALAVLLTGCASDPAPVGESKVVTRATRVSGSGPKAVAPAPAFHVVERGDTLFSIAWRHGLDYREVARINGIAEPWVIRVGQQLRLRDMPAGSTARVATAAAPATRKATAAPSSARPAAPVPGTTTTTGTVAGGAAAGAVVGPSSAPAAGGRPAPGTLAPPALSAEGWAWPSAGRVLAAYSPGGAGPRGVALDGAAGDPVRAARDGRVVYTGSSLVGYGQLVILKHDEVYLSAYAHNSRLLVKEGDRVRAGDVIAEMGSTGADRVKLHFEIRRNGEPVDPQALLPRR